MLKYLFYTTDKKRNNALESVIKRGLKDLKYEIEKMSQSQVTIEKPDKIVDIVHKILEFPWTYVINDLNGEQTFGTFYEKELQKSNQKEFRIEKVTKKKETNYMLNGTNMIIHLVAGFIKKT